MNRSFRTAVGSVILLALMGAGFSSGRAIGSRLRPHAEPSLSPWIAGSSSDVEDRSAPTSSPSDVFASVLGKVQQDYVGSTGTAPVSNARLAQGALGRMVASLHDPHTVYLDSSRTESRVNAILGKRYGIGADLAVVTNKSKLDDLNYSFLTVKSVAHGSPAELAGLHSGDHISEINGQWIIAYPVLSDTARQRDEPLDELPDSKYDDKKQDGASQIKPGITAERAIRVLTSGTDKHYRLTVDGSGRNAPKPIDITTGQTITPTLEHRQPGPGVTYLLITEFNSDVASAIDNVLSRRYDWSVGLIIDLRQSPGGVEADKGSRFDGYRCALDLIGQVAEKSAVGQIERKPGVRSPIVAAGTRPTTNWKARVAVLIDGGTSNIAEMAAAGMRDAGGAKLIGAHTSGDDVLPYLSVFKTGGAIEVACAHLLTVGGEDLSSGIRPDILIDSAAAIRGQMDPTLQRALRFVSAQ